MAFLGRREPVDRTEGEVPARRGDLQGAEALANHPVYTGPTTSSQLVALRQLEYLSGEQGHAYEAVSSSRQPLAPIPASETQDQHGGRTAGRHHASRSRGDEFLRRHGARFASFSVIGGGIFVAGLLLQALLTSGLHVPSLISYIVQAVISVEASYFLNRWFTWKGTRTPLWSSFLRYNLQKAVTVTVNLILYGLLLKLGVEYLLDNILLTMVFTFVNYIGADKLVFLSGSRQIIEAVTGPFPAITGSMPMLRPDRKPANRSRRTWREMPSISVVIPVRSNEKTIRAAVDSILGQDYPHLRELILVGSPGESTWSGLQGINDPRIFVMETKTPPGIRDANFKRNLGIRRTSGELVSLIDSDMVLPQGWMSNAVRLLMESEVDCVAGVMRSISDDFWGRFVDRNRLGAKTPRADAAYLVTAEGFGAAAYKPPITADILFTRKMYEDCPIDSSWTHGSLEDYEWFWRIVERGHKVLVSNQLFGWHHHRAGFGNLSREYRRSARGCAFFIRAHHESPFAQKRMTQAVMLPMAAFGALLAIAAAAYMHHGKLAVASVAAFALVGTAFLSAREFVRSRTVESLLYPIPALVLGANYTASLVANLIKNTPVYEADSTALDFPAVTENSQSHGRGSSVLRYPLILILSLQSALSLSLLWRNTAFTDEAEYLWAGHLEIAHWLHGASLPSLLTNTMSGSPIIYPPLGALADSVGGLTGARLLSLMFMLGSTALLYSVAKQLISKTAAIFATALWAISEPTIHLGDFATYDALSILLTALSVWLCLRAVTRNHRGEYIATAGLTLALANADAYSGVVMDPVVVAFAFFAWVPVIGMRKAGACVGWLIGAVLVSFVAAMTVSRSWKAIAYTIFLRGTDSGFSYTRNSVSFVMGTVWSCSGLYLVLSILGLIVVFRFEPWKRRLLICTMVGAAFVVPISQLRYLTVISLDKHLAYGIWFASMACGYGCSRLVRRIPGIPVAAVALSGVLGLTYFIAGSWQAAYYKQLSWSNSTAFINALRPIAATNTGQIDATTEDYVARYYTSQGADWSRWSQNNLLLDLPKVPVSDQVSTYLNKLNSANYSVIALFYSTTVHGLPASVVLSLNGDIANATILNIIAGNGVSASTEGQTALTVALEDDSSYRLASVGPFNTATISGIFAIWEKKAP